MNAQQSITFDSSVCLITQDPPLIKRSKLKGAFLSLGIPTSEDCIDEFILDVVDDVLLDLPAYSRIQIPYELIVRWNSIKKN